MYSGPFDHAISNYSVQAQSPQLLQMFPLSFAEQEELQPSQFKQLLPFALAQDAPLQSSHFEQVAQLVFALEDELQTQLSPFVQWFALQVADDVQTHPLLSQAAFLPLFTEFANTTVPTARTIAINTKNIFFILLILN